MIIYIYLAVLAIAVYQVSSIWLVLGQLSIRLIRDPAFIRTKIQY